MSPTATIRDATPKDTAAIKEIIAASFPRFFHYFALHSVKSGPPLLVSEAEGMVMGFAKLIEFNTRNRKYGCILWLATHPNHRRKGVALSLVLTGSEYLKQKGAYAVFASVQRTNKASLATFAHAGYRRIGFWGLQRLFGRYVFGFYRSIWFAPGEVVLICD